MEWIVLLQENYLFILLGILILLMFKNRVLAKIYKLEKISADDAYDIYRENVNRAVFLDVRTPRETENSPIIKRSKIIPLSELSGRMEELKNLGIEQRIVIVCRSDSRSVPAGIKLKRAGFSNVYVMKGGLLAWKKAKYPVAMKKTKKKR